MSALDSALSTQLQKKLVELRMKAVDLIAGGKCADFSEYRYSVGYLQALYDVDTVAKEIIEDMQKF